MKKALPLTVMLAAILLLTACNTQKDETGSAALVQSTEKAAAAKTAEGDPELLHHSQPTNDVDAYQAMERAVEAGKLKSIGLSNYYEPEDFDRLVNATTIKPALLQNETHPYHQSGEMKEYIAQYGTVLEKDERFADY